MNIFEFVTNNQTLIIAVLMIISYFAKRLVDYQAAKPEENVWDKVKPASDVLYQIVHSGVELLAKSKQLPAAEKLIEYQKQIKQFEANWKASPIKAVEELAAWYLSMQQKGVALNPSQPTISQDSQAVE